MSFINFTLFLSFILLFSVAAEAKKTESAGSTVSAAKTDFVNDSKTENASSRDRSARGNNRYFSAPLFDL